MRSLLALALLAGAVSAQQPAWAQCGGIGWSGATTCVSGYACVAQNAYYSQCVPGAAPSTTAPAPSTTATVTATTTKSTASATSTGPAAPAASGVQIRGVQDPVFHLYLQNANGTAVLGPEASSGRFTIGGSIALNGGPAPLYLNVGSESTSYRSLSFGAAPSFAGWGLEGDTIITTTSSTYGRQLNFVACPAAGASGTFKVFLQLGSDVPSAGCANFVSLHLPCLC